MLKYKIKSGTNHIVIPLSETFDFVDKDEALNLSYIPQQVTKHLPIAEDFEINRLAPENAEIISIQIFQDSIPLYLSDYGFSDDDIKLFSNRIRKSFLRLSFYDTPNKLKRQSQFEVDLFIQRSSFYDVNNNIKLASEIPLIFYIKTPFLYNNETEGFYVYLKNNNQIFLDSSSLYVNFRFNSALDGLSYVYYPKDNLTTDNLTEDLEYVEVQINSPSKLYRYSETNRTLLYTGSNLNIDLHGLN